MNSYSWLEQNLHKFALSWQFMREVTFDFESTNLPSSTESENHIFITGFARSGTTILLNALYESNVFGSLSYADMPFILAPNLWSKFSFLKKAPISRFSLTVNPVKTFRVCGTKEMPCLTLS